MDVLSSVFEDDSDKSPTVSRSKSEPVTFEFRDHPNIIRLLNVHRADNDKDLYLVFEFMNTDLQRAIQR